jgi:hypothetical protein
VDLLEQPAQATQFPDGGRVGTADDRATEGSEAHQFRDREPCSFRDLAELLLLARCDANVEPLDETGRPSPTKRHRILAWCGCEKR